MFLLAICTVFMLSVEDTVSPILPPASVPAVMVQDTIPSAVPDSIPQDTIPPALPDSIPQDTIPPAVPDSVRQNTILPGAPPGANYTRQTQQEVLTDTVEVWNYRIPEGFEVGETDSTLRWTNLLNLFDRFHQKRGAITNRTGTVGRMDGLDLHTFETRHLSLEMEGLDITRSLTGDVDWNRLPIHKLKSFYEAEYGATYRSEARLRDHYLTEPRTYLNFDESKFNYRSLEFSATRNFTPATNAELSFWDRRDGGGYSRSGVEGRQIVGRVYHQLTDNWLLKSAFINNGMDRQESFGYVMAAPEFFLFNRFVASAEESSAESNQSSSDIYVQAHYRRDKYEDVSSEFGLHYQTEKWDLTYSADTVATAFRKIELFARQHLQLRGTTLRGTGRLFYLNETEKQNLLETQWLGGRFNLNLTQAFTSWSRFHGFANITAWNDDRLSSEVSGRLEINPLPNTTLAAFGGVLSRAPDIQSLYWQAEEYMGNPALRNEEAVTGGALVELGFGNLTIGGRGDYRSTENGHFADTEGNFINLASYSQVSATGWIGLDSEMFEGEISAVYKQFSSTGTTEVDARLNLSGDRTWLKGHLYWKNYLFDRATYVTAGFSGVLSPNAFRTAEFLPEINRWQHGTNEYINPSYYRLDLDVSARIRWFMVLIKWENILDRVGQAGYFEAPGYPMPERRFTVGLRILFTN